MALVLLQLWVSVMNTIMNSCAALIMQPYDYDQVRSIVHRNVNTVIVLNGVCQVMCDM